MILNRNRNHKRYVNFGIIHVEVNITELFSKEIKGKQKVIQFYISVTEKKANDLLFSFNRTWGMYPIFPPWSVSPRPPSTINSPESSLFFPTRIDKTVDFPQPDAPRNP